MGLKPLVKNIFQFIYKDRIFSKFCRCLVRNAKILILVSMYVIFDGQYVFYKYEFFIFKINLEFQQSDIFLKVKWKNASLSCILVNVENKIKKWLKYLQTQ